MGDTKFKPGQPRLPGAGRKKGTLNKRNQELLAILEARDFSPADKLIGYCEQIEKIIALRLRNGNLAGALVALEKAGNIVGDIAQYAYPKKKAVEHSGEVGVKTFADFMAAAKGKK